MPSKVVSGIRRRFQRLSQSQGQIAHVLLTRSPLIRGASSPSPFDLHVLSTPPAFVLSQDQTLRKCLIAKPPKRPAHLVQKAAGIGEQSASLKLTEQIITDLLCCLMPHLERQGLFNIISKGISIAVLARNEPYNRGFWHLTLCTLLSSQGSDAPRFRPRCAAFVLGQPV